MSDFGRLIFWSLVFIAGIALSVAIAKLIYALLGNGFWGSIIASLAIVVTGGLLIRLATMHSR